MVDTFFLKKSPAKHSMSFPAAPGWCGGPQLCSRFTRKPTQVWELALLHCCKAVVSWCWSVLLCPIRNFNLYASLEICRENDFSSLNLEFARIQIHVHLLL